jgi:hypothetical protein
MRNNISVIGLILLLTFLMTIFMASSIVEAKDINDPIAKRSLTLRDLIHNVVVQKRANKQSCCGPEVVALVANEGVCLFFLTKVF